MFSCCGFFSNKDESGTEMKERGYRPLDNDMDVTTGLPKESEKEKQAREKKAGSFGFDEKSRAACQARFGLSTERMQKMDRDSYRAKQKERRGLDPDPESRSDFQSYDELTGSRRNKVTPNVIRQLKEEITKGNSNSTASVTTPPGGLSLGVNRR